MAEEKKKEANKFVIAPRMNDLVYEFAKAVQDAEEQKNKLKRLTTKPPLKNGKPLTMEEWEESDKKAEKKVRADMTAAAERMLERMLGMAERGEEFVHTAHKPDGTTGTVREKVNSQADMNEQHEWMLRQNIASVRAVHAAARDKYDDTYAALYAANKDKEHKEKLPGLYADAKAALDTRLGVAKEKRTLPTMTRPFC